jgi:uncharacterized damage-inducible protein DinB
MVHTAIARPGPGEYLPYFDRYIGLVRSDDALEALVSLAESTPRYLSGVGEAQAAHRYAPGKWSVKQTLGHLCDCERVFAYRAMRIARADATALPGFEENDYAANGGFDARPFADIVVEFRAVRAASIALFGSLTEEAQSRCGTANGAVVSPRALAWIIAGHELHHMGLLRERYGIRES